jgi:hypothetical protein
MVAAHRPAASADGDPGARGGIAVGRAVRSGRAPLQLPRRQDVGWRCVLLCAAEPSGVRRRRAVPAGQLAAPARSTSNPPHPAPLHTTLPPRAASPSRSAASFPSATSSPTRSAGQGSPAAAAAARRRRPVLLCCRSQPPADASGGRHAPPARPQHYDLPVCRPLKPPSPAPANLGELLSGDLLYDSP